MARPHLFTHRKFLRLSAILRMPKPHVLGHLEYLWESGYRNACSVVGDEIDIELVSEWQGEPKAFANALIETGFVDRTELGLEIHDFWTHAPEYVKKRVVTEQRLSDAGTTLSEVRQLAGLAGVAAKQAKVKQTVSNLLGNQANGQQMVSNLLGNQANGQQTVSKVVASLPSPSLPNIELGVPNSLLSDKPTDIVEDVLKIKKNKTYSEKFQRFWNECPRIACGRSGRDQVYPELWNKLGLEKDEHFEYVMKSLSIWKRSYEWTRDEGRAIPGIHRWLKSGRYKEKPI